MTTATQADLIKIIERASTVVRERLNDKEPSDRIALEVMFDVLKDQPSMLQVLSSMKPYYMYGMFGFIPAGLVFTAGECSNKQIGIYMNSDAIEERNLARPSAHPNTLAALPKDLEATVKYFDQPSSVTLSATEQRDLKRIGKPFRRLTVSNISNIQRWNEQIVNFPPVDRLLYASKEAREAQGAEALRQLSVKKKFHKQTRKLFDYAEAGGILTLDVHNQLPKSVLDKVYAKYYDFQIGCLMRIVHRLIAEVRGGAFGNNTNLTKVPARISSVATELVGAIEAKVRNMTESGMHTEALPDKKTRMAVSNFVNWLYDLLEPHPQWRDGFFDRNNPLSFYKILYGTASTLESNAVSTIPEATARALSLLQDSMHAEAPAQRNLAAAHQALKDVGVQNPEKIKFKPPSNKEVDVLQYYAAKLDKQNVLNILEIGSCDEAACVDEEHQEKERQAPKTNGSGNDVLNGLTKSEKIERVLAEARVPPNCPAEFQKEFEDVVQQMQDGKGPFIPSGRVNGKFKGIDARDFFTGKTFTKEQSFRIYLNHRREVNRKKKEHAAAVDILYPATKRNRSEDNDDVTRAAEEPPDKILKEENEKLKKELESLKAAHEFTAALLTDSRSKQEGQPVNLAAFQHLTQGLAPSRARDSTGQTVGARLLEKLQSEGFSIHAVDGETDKGGIPASMIDHTEHHVLRDTDGMVTFGGKEFTFANVGANKIKKLQAAFLELENTPLEDLGWKPNEREANTPAILCESEDSLGAPPSGQDYRLLNAADQAYRRLRRLRKPCEANSQTAAHGSESHAYTRPYSTPHEDESVDAFEDIDDVAAANVTMPTRSPTIVSTRITDVNLMSRLDGPENEFRTFVYLYDNGLNQNGKALVDSGATCFAMVREEYIPTLNKDGRTMYIYLFNDTEKANQKITTFGKRDGPQVIGMCGHMITWHIKHPDGTDGEYIDVFVHSHIVRGTSPGADFLLGGRYLALHAIIPYFTAANGTMKSQALMMYNTFVSDTLPKEVLAELGKPGTYPNMVLTTNPEMRKALASACQRQEVTGVSNVTKFGIDKATDATSAESTTPVRTSQRINTLVSALQPSIGDDVDALANEVSRLEGIQLTEAKALVEEVFEAMDVSDDAVYGASPSL